MTLLSSGDCDRFISENPFWNHSINNSPDLIKNTKLVLSAQLAAMSFHEAVNLYRLTQRTNHLLGDIAECGVYRGGSALLICLARAEWPKKIHLFDTFSGLPEATESLDLHGKGEFKGGSLDEIKRLLSQFKNISFYEGIFPLSASDIPSDNTFSMVNLDMDTYLSTKEALIYFYPRMVKGGVILCHDYSSLSCPGVKVAIDEFLENKPETPIELWHTQLAIVKM